MTGAGPGRVAADPFAAFRDEVHRDPELQTRLAAIPDVGAFVEAVMAAAAERGHAVSAADVAAAMRAGHIAWLTAGCEVL